MSDYSKSCYKKTKRENLLNRLTMRTLPSVLFYVNCSNAAELPNEDELFPCRIVSWK